MARTSPQRRPGIKHTEESLTVYYNPMQIGFNHSGTKAGTFLENNVNTVAAVVPAPYITKSWQNPRYQRCWIKCHCLPRGRTSTNSMLTNIRKCKHIFVFAGVNSPRLGSIWIHTVCPSKAEGITLSGGNMSSGETDVSSRHDEQPSEQQPGWIRFAYTIICISLMWCRYSAVNFLKNIHKRHPIARPLGRGMGCILWIQHLIDILPEFLQSFMWCFTILDRVITALACTILLSISHICVAGIHSRSLTCKDCIQYHHINGMATRTSSSSRKSQDITQSINLRSPRVQHQFKHISVLDSHGKLPSCQWHLKNCFWCTCNYIDSSIFKRLLKFKIHICTCRDFSDDENDNNGTICVHWLHAL